MHSARDRHGPAGRDVCPACWPAGSSGTAGNGFHGASPSRASRHLSWNLQLDWVGVGGVAGRSAPFRGQHRRAAIVWPEAIHRLAPSWDQGKQQLTRLLRRWNARGNLSGSSLTSTYSILLRCLFDRWYVLLSVSLTHLLISRRTIHHITAIGTIVGVIHIPMCITMYIYK